MVSPDNVHKFHCIYCKRHEFGNTAAELARNVNGHNGLFHPMDYSKWDADSVVRSVNYTGPTSPAQPGALPQYIVRHGLTTNSRVTAADRAFLREHKIIWD